MDITSLQAASFRQGHAGVADQSYKPAWLIFQCQEFLLDLNQIRSRDRQSFLLHFVIRAEGTDEDIGLQSTMFSDGKVYDFRYRREDMPNR